MKMVNSDTLASEILKKECILTDTMHRTGYAVFTSDIMKTISDVESVDAVEVVRCKDCKWFRRYIDTDIEFCDLTEHTTFGADFCSRAVRMDGDYE